MPFSYTKNVVFIRDWSVHLNNRAHTEQEASTG